jgi:hypothetical protein
MLILPRHIEETFASTILLRLRKLERYQIPKGYSEAFIRWTDNTMAKRKRTKLFCLNGRQNTAQKIRSHDTIPTKI